ncbi:MAG: hypothetical protein AAF713_16360 [Pseudomonadota bacterium]
MSAMRAFRLRDMGPAQLEFGATLVALLTVLFVASEYARPWIAHGLGSERSVLMANAATALDRSQADGPNGAAPDKSASNQGDASSRGGHPFAASRHISSSMPEASSMQQTMQRPQRENRILWR